MKKLERFDRGFASFFIRGNKMDETSIRENKMDETSILEIQSDGVINTVLRPLFTLEVVTSGGFGKNPLAAGKNLFMVGKTVIVRNTTVGESNGHLEQPGIVTWLWEEHDTCFCCNVKVFPDGGSPYDMPAAMIYKYQIDAEDPEKNLSPNYCGWLA